MYKSYIKSRKNNNLEIIVPYQIDSITGNNGKLDSLIVKDLDGAKKDLNVNYFLPFFWFVFKFRAN